MMNKLCTATNHIVLKIILGIIILSFLLTGIGNYLIKGNNDYVANINGQKISRTQLDQMVQNEYNRQQESLGEQFFQLMSNKNYIQQIRQQILSQLINETLLYLYADKLGLTVSNDQIKKIILLTSAFYVNEKFNNNKFHSLLNKIGLSPEQYASLIRKQLLTQQLIHGIDNAKFLLPTEINRLLALVIQKRKVRIATFDITSLANKQITNDEEIQSNYSMHKTKYLLPESYKISYIKIDTKNIESQITINEQEIQNWYDQHHDQLTIPEQKRYSIIRCKTEKQASNLLKQLQQGADFATLAKVHSTDIISAKNGGDIGWVSDHDSIEELKQAHLYKKKQLSSIIKSTLGFLIIILNDIQPPQLQSLNSVHHEVITKVKQEKAINAYYVLQQKLSDATRKDNSTLKLAEITTGIKAQQTDWFNRDNIPTILNYEPIKKELFQGSFLGNNLLPGSNSEVIPVQGNIAFVIHIDNHRPEYIRPLKDVYIQVQQEVKRYKALKQARKWANKALSDLKNSKNSKDSTVILQKLGIDFSTPQEFNSIDDENSLTQTIFSMQPPQGKSVYGIASNTQGDIVLIELNSVTPSQCNDTLRKEFTNQISQSIVNTFLDTLIISLRSEYKEKIFLNDITY